jgi:Flp pilus assembly protein TadB
MKKLLLISSFLLIAIQTFSYSPKNTAKTITNSNVSFKIKGMTLQQFLLLTPKKYQEITGKRMTFKQKISFFILKAKLKKQLPDEKVEGKKSNLGLLSLIFGGAAFVFVPIAAIVSIPLAVAAVVLGILGLGKSKGDTKSIIGLVLGATFILLFVILVATFSFHY